MAISYKSRAYIGGVPFRSTAEAPFSVSASVVVPAGALLASGDLFKFFKLGANVRVLDVVFSTDDLDTGAAVTLDLGYDAASLTDNDDAFIADSTVGQAGGVVQVSNGGDDPFAVGLLAPIAETITIQAKVETAPSADVATARKLTCTARCVMETAAPSDTPYVYADRYSTAGVGTI